MMLADDFAAEIGRLRGEKLENKIIEAWRELKTGRLTLEQVERLQELVQQRRETLKGEPLQQPPLPGFQPSRKPPAIAPVRRQSWRQGRCETGFWRSISKDQGRQVMDAARRYDEHGRKQGKREKGKRIGPLGPVGLEILQLFVNMAVAGKGRVEPSLQYIMSKIDRSKCAVVDALARLREHGFIDWRRRYVPTGNAGPGPQVKQTSNAYRLIVETAQRVLSWLKKPSPPLPDDVQQRLADREAELATHKANLSPSERVHEKEWENSSLADSLAALGRHVALKKQRESDDRAEISPTSLSVKESRRPIKSPAIPAAGRAGERPKSLIAPPLA